MSTVQIRSLETRLYAAREQRDALATALRDILALVNMAPAGKERDALELIADRVVAEGVQS